MYGDIFFANHKFYWFKHTYKRVVVFLKGLRKFKLLIKNLHYHFLFLSTY